MSTMEENKFEKQVRQKMDELKINPSDSVWENIKSGIEKRKERKWGLLIFLLLLITALTGGYWFLNSPDLPNSKSKEAINTNIEKKIKYPGIRNKNDVKEEKAETGQLTTDQKELSNNLSEKVNDDNKNFTASREPINENVKRKLFKKKTKGNLVATVASSEVATMPVDKEGNDRMAARKPNIENDIDNANDKILSDVKIDSNNTEKDIAAIGDSTIESKNKKDTTTKNIVAKKFVTAPSKSRWQVGIFMAGGISHVGNQFLGLGNSSSADYLQSPGNNGSTGGAIIPSPSQIKNSAGYVVGIFLEKNISKKTKVLFGINYKEFNTSNLVGQKNDTTGGVYYDYYSRNSNAKKQYNNNFKFIEMPLGIKVLLGDNKNFPVFWSGGITLSQLVKSNALQFDARSGIYYKENSLLNKTHLGFSTALSTTLFQNRKFAMLFGPYFQYSASQLANQGLYNKKHFVFIGLYTEILFREK